jgi:4-diphosphocytidyl-2-C-methyl-D-erythritol kinase
MLSVLAPAKLNLTLEVLAERGDGFHEISTVVQTISLCDRLDFKMGDDITFKCNEAGWLFGKSLVSRVASLLQESFGCSHGATITVHKRIPLMSGLGGDSSDAAACLHGLNKLWGLSLSQEELTPLASQLGSDVAFLLFGGTALLEGRGEVISPLPSLPHMWVVLLIPPVSRPIGKTAQLYASLETSHYTGGQITDDLVRLLSRGEGVTSANLVNVFDNVADDNFFGLNNYRKQFLKAGAGSVHLTGSGPALFTLMKDKIQAEKIYQHLQQKGLKTYLVETLDVVDQVGLNSP